MTILNPCSFHPKYPSTISVSSSLLPTSKFKQNKHPLTNAKSGPVVFSASKKQRRLFDPTVPLWELGKKITQKWLQHIFKSLDDSITNFVDLPLRPSIDPHHVLSGNFAPVNELPPTACEVVQGPLPSCLDGAYIRNGPNPQFIPQGPYHLFDGDGMLHMVKISWGKASFCSRYVRTYKYTVERELGYPVFPSPFSSFNGLAASLARSMLLAARILTWQINPIDKGFGLANTSVALIGSRLFALGESDLPYEIKITPEGDIISLGRHDFYTDEPFLSMTAHPKVDPETGEAFAFRYNVAQPLLTLFRIDSNGKKQPDMPIFSMRSTSLTHDLAVTKNHIIFCDTQLVMDFREIIKGRTPARVDSAKVPRLGIIPRNAKDGKEMIWIEAPGFNMMHCFNAWEEDDGNTVVIVASNLSNIELALESLDLAELILEKVTINIKTRTFEAYPLSNKVLDMGGINKAYSGKRSRYIYASIVDQPSKLIGVVKFDLSLSTDSSPDCMVASRLYGPSCSGSEMFFVPRDPDNASTSEDDGYLIAYVHHEDKDESKLLVMDAKSPTLETVAVVKLPGRVPTGFHGLFVRQCELNKVDECNIESPNLLTL